MQPSPFKFKALHIGKTDTDGPKNNALGGESRFPEPH